MRKVQAERVRAILLTGLGIPGVSMHTEECGICGMYRTDIPGVVHGWIVGVVDTHCAPDEGEPMHSMIVQYAPHHIVRVYAWEWPDMRRASSKQARLPF